MKISTISRMKPLISPSISSFSPKFSKPTLSFPLFSLPYIFNHCNFTLPQKSPNFSQVKPTIMMSSLNSNPNRALNLHTEASQVPSGEIHVIVGPMFAGKTTTLLRRVQSESINGRFGLSILMAEIILYV